MIVTFLIIIFFVVSYLSFFDNKKHYENTIKVSQKKLLTEYEKEVRQIQDSIRKCQYYYELLATIDSSLLNKLRSKHKNVVPANVLRDDLSQLWAQYYNKKSKLFSEKKVI